MRKILIVDDHQDIRRMIRVALGSNFEVMEASDGLGCLAIARRMKPDIVVLDVMMPGDLNGLQVLDTIKSDPNLKHTRVIMVTAKGQVHDHEDGIRRGADAYFIKPFSPLQLVATIEDFLAKINQRKLKTPRRRARLRCIPLYEAEANMVLGAPIYIARGGIRNLLLPAGHRLTGDNLNQLAARHIEFIFVLELDGRSDEQVAFDAAQAAHRLMKVFAGADLTDSTMAALFEQVYMYRST